MVSGLFLSTPDFISATVGERSDALRLKQCLMKRILVAYDASAQSENALEELSRSGLGPRCEILVMSVADVWLPANPSSAPYPDTDPAAVRDALARAEQTIARMATLATNASRQLAILHPRWTVTPYSCGDSPAWAILHKAVEWKADLVVLGSHSRSVLERFFLGSVSAKVAAEATCSVRIARPRSDSMGGGKLRIVVAVDGSADSQAAVQVVAGRVWESHCEFRVATVMDQRMESTITFGSGGRADFRRRSDEGARDALLRLLQADARTLSQSGLTVETCLLVGDPKNELLTMADEWRADAIFIGSRGIHHGGRLSLGTMASAVASRAQSSVEIVRP